MNGVEFVSYAVYVNCVRVSTLKTRYMEMNGIPVITPLPSNLCASERARFEPQQHLYTKPIQVREWKNVFVTRSGIVLKNFRLVKDSIFQHIGRDNQYYKTALINYFLRKKIRLAENQTYLLIHNYFLSRILPLITDALQRLWSVRAQTAELALMLPDGMPPYVLENVNLFILSRFITFQSTIPLSSGFYYQ